MADGVHAAGVPHLIAEFEIFCDPLFLGILPDEQVIGLLGVAVEVGEILFERPISFSRPITLFMIVPC